MLCPPTGHPTRTHARADLASPPQTTLVNHILTGNHGKRIAIIENEFGEVGIDDGLVLETQEEIFEMNNGCVCCTVRGDLIRIIQKLLKRKNKFDHIIIETTGLADPAPVAQTFYADQTIKEGCALDAIITVVDCKHIMQHLDEVKPEGVVNEALQQVAFADKMLINKVDLVAKPELQGIKERLHAVNKYAEMIETQKSNIDLDKVLGISAFNLGRIMEIDEDFVEKDAHAHDHGHGHDHHDHDCKEEGCDHDHHDHDHDHHDHKHGHGHGHGHKHDDAVTSVGIEAPGNLDMMKVNTWLSTLLQTKGADIYRSKGILAIDGSDDKYVFQGVHMLLDMASSAEGVGRPWRAGEARVNKLVFIGKNLDRAELETEFRACLVA